MRYDNIFAQCLPVASCNGIPYHVNQTLMRCAFLVHADPRENFAALQWKEAVQCLPVNSSFVLFTANAYYTVLAAPQKPGLLRRFVPCRVGLSTVLLLAVEGAKLERLPLLGQI